MKVFSHYLLISYFPCAFTANIWTTERESSFRLLYRGKYAIDWVRNDWIPGSLYGSGPRNECYDVTKWK